MSRIIFSLRVTFSLFTLCLCRVELYSQSHTPLLEQQHIVKIYLLIQEEQYMLAAHKLDSLYGIQKLSEEGYIDFLADVRFKQRRFDEALVLFQKKISYAKETEKQQYCRLRIAQIAAGLGESTLCYSSLSQYLLHSPKIREYELQNDTLLQRFRNAEWWHTLWQKDNYSAADLVYSELQWLYLQKKYEDLIFYYQNSPEKLLPPNLNACKYIYAQALCQVNSLESAAFELRQVLKKSPQNIDALTLLSTIYSRQKNKKHHYLTLKKLLQCAPYLDFPYLDMAQLLYQKKKYKESSSYLSLYKICIHNNLDAQWLDVQLKYKDMDYIGLLPTLSELITKQYKLEETLLLRVNIYLATDFVQLAAQDLKHRITIKPLYDDEILKYVKQFYAKKEVEMCCVLLKSASQSLNPEIEYQFNKLCKPAK